MEPQADYLSFLTPDYRNPDPFNLLVEDDFSEPSSDFSSTTTPSSPEVHTMASFTPDSLLSPEDMKVDEVPSPLVMVLPESLSTTDYTPDAMDALLSEDDDLDDDVSCAKRSRKRRKTSEEDSVEVPPPSNIPIPEPESGEMLSREHLLALSSLTFEDYISRLQATRDLTGEEKKEVKRQRRLIKNRESAQASRQRKKSYLDKLEQKVAAISSVNAQLREQLNAMQTSNRSLVSENKSLKDQVARLQTALQKNNLSGLIESGAKLVAAANSDPHSGSGVSRIGNHTRTAGVCLMVLLFSFGLLFPQLQRGNSPFTSSTGDNLQISRLDKGDSYQLASTDQELPEILAEQNFNTRRISNQYGQRFKDQESVPATPASPVSMDEESSLYEDSAVMSGSDDDLPPRNYAGEAKRKRSELTSIHETPETLSQMSAIEVGGDEMLNATQVPHVDVPVITEWNKDTTYLLCDNIKHMAPAIIAASGKSVPTAIVETADTQQVNESFVAFYIPPEPTANSESSSHPSKPLQFMELKCKIIGVDMVPAIRKHGRFLPSLPLVEAS